MGLLGRLFGLGKAGDSGPPGRLGLPELARRLGMTDAALAAVRVSYQEFQIPRRSGKPRTINAPSPELKKVQRTILRRLLSRLKAHPAATAYERGHSIATHASLHARQSVVVRIDIHDYFTRTTADRVRMYFRTIGWDKAAAARLTELCTLNGGLPQGAPTSPRLSNLVNWAMDAPLHHIAEKLGARYSRYADDLTFSFAEDDQKKIHSAIGCTKAVLEGLGYEMHLQGKLLIRRRDYERQLVTGLVVNDGVRLPRERRRWLRAVEHRMARGGKATLTAAQLAGWRAYESMIEEQSRSEDPDR